MKNMSTNGPKLIIDISLPLEQVQLLNEVKVLLEQFIASQTKSHYLTEKQAAESFGISAGELQKWRADGIVRYKKIGHRVVRYKLSELFEDFEVIAAIRMINKPSIKVIEKVKAKFEAKTKKP